MLYELHMTTDPKVNVEDFCNVAKGFGLKPLRIQLLGEQHVEAQSIQLMTASTFQNETHEGALDRANGHRRNMERLGQVPILRSKLEVPLDKAAQAGYGRGDCVYHEVHVKVLMDPSTAITRLYGAIERDWVISRNLLYAEANGREKWYLTQRAYNCTPLQAGMMFAQEWDEIRGAFPGFARMEMETVMLDTNPDLDKGWA